MTYDLKHVKAPRLAGKALRAFVALIENPASRAVIAPKLLADMGVKEFRALQVAEGPTLYAQHPFDASAQATEAPDLAPLFAPRETPEGFHFRTVAEYREAYRSGATTPEEVVGKLLQSIRAADSKALPLRAMIAIREDDIMTQAKASTERWAAGAPIGPLDGIPVATKDEMDLAGYPTTVGTAFMGQGGVASTDATVAARLRAAGAIMIGKSNMHEIGSGTTGINPHHGAARNPYNLSHMTGGSSSGSSAATAAGFCPITIGADGGGSIRLPAALCGVVGLKATFGRISEAGAAPLCWSVAHIGPIAGSARDAALAYALMAGPDPLDPHSQHQPAIDLDDLDDHDLTGVTLGIFSPWFDDASPEVVASCRVQVEHFRERGAEIREIQIPALEAMRVAHLITIASEMASAMSSQAAHQKEFGLDIRINLAIAKQFSSNDYLLAQRIRTQGLAIFDEIFSEVDGIITPTTGRTAPGIRPEVLPDGESDLTTVIDLMRFVTPANLLGFPAISFPVGYDSNNLPIGCHVMGPAWSEGFLLRLAAIAEARVTLQAPSTHVDLLD